MSDEKYEVTEAKTAETTGQKKVGRKFILSLIVTLAGILAAVCGFVIDNQSELISIAGMVISLISTISYVYTEGKLDALSLKKAIDTIGDIVETVGEMDFPCEENTTNKVEAKEEVPTSTDTTDAPSSDASEGN